MGWTPERAVKVRALAGDIVLRSWATLIVPLSTQGYKWVQVNCWGNLTKFQGMTCDGLASRPGGSRNTSSSLTCYRNRDKLWQLRASLGSKASLT